MRNRVLVFIFFCMTAAVYGQQAESLFFREKLHDFGEITEKDGPAVYEFTYTNLGVRPVKIITVQASCGCTTPDWTKEAVAPGKTGFIKASFDPKNRPGYFDKTLSVATDADSKSLILQIKGTVVEQKADKKPYDLAIEHGNLRFKYNSVNFGKIFINKENAVYTFDVYNAGKSAIQLKQIISPVYIKSEFPTQIAPGQKVVVKLTYDAKARNHYGFVSDNITLVTDDIVQPDKSFSVYATIEEYFAILSHDEQSKAPNLAIEVPSVDFGKVSAGTDLVRDIKIKNSGKKDLIIHEIQPNCSCLITKLAMTKIKENEEVALQVTFNTTGRTGPQQKAITIYSNDPRNPVQRITIIAYIE